MRINKGYNYGKVVSNHDVRLLLCFAIKELGSYKIIYKKDCYCRQFTIILILAIIAGVLSIFGCLCSDFRNSIIAILISCISITASFVLGYNLRERAKQERFNLQSVRVEMLRAYYSEENYDCFQIEKICELLKIKLKHLEKNAIYVLIIAGSLFLSLWTSYVQQVVGKNPDAGFTEIALFLILRIIILLFILAMFAPFLNLLRELSFNSFSQIYLIENLIYLTTYIVHERQPLKLKKVVNCKNIYKRKYQRRHHKYERKRRIRG